MSGICGVINFDGAPVEPDLLTKMAQVSAYLGPDGITYWVKDNVGLAYLALNTTPEAQREKQPLVSNRKGLVIVWDGRVDNRDELIDVLTAKGYLEVEVPTDAEIILACFENWGEACPSYILGDFSFAIWDDIQKRLFCARDFIGSRPFFYMWQGKQFLFGSALKNILAGLKQKPQLNRLLISDFLCRQFGRLIHETVYQNILRLPGSYSMVVTQEQEHLTCYWNPKVGEVIRYPSEEDYFEQFRDLFSNVLRRHLRSSTAVGIFMSGGLDSSSIACMLHKMIEGNAYLYKPINLISLAFKNTHADEREYQQSVFSYCNQFPVLSLDGEQSWGLKEFGDENGFPLDEPDTFPIRSNVLLLTRAAKDNGCRVVITGEGADYLLIESPYCFPEFLLDIDLFRNFSELKYFNKRNGFKIIPVFFSNAILPILRPLIPNSLLTLRRQLINLRSKPEWVRRNLVILSSQSYQEIFTRPRVQLANHQASMIFRQLTSGWFAASLSYLTRTIASLGVECRLPFLDRRIIEFMLMIPGDLRFSKGLNKYFLREAMKGILPEIIRQRTSVAYFDDEFHYGLREKERTKVKTMLDETPSYLEDFLDSKILAHGWEMYYNSIEAIDMWALVSPLYFQSWRKHSANW